MNDINDFKREKREQFEGGQFTYFDKASGSRHINEEKINAFLDSYAEELLVWVEKEVDPLLYNSWECDHKTEVKEAFTRLRGESETNV